jgi:hypothetical protein
VVTLSDEQKATRAMARRHKAALAAEAEAMRQEARRREWQANGTYLTREEFEAGVHCRGCGLPIIDRLGSWLPLMEMTEVERADHEAAEAAFKHRHSDCRSHRWSMSGSRTVHCGSCCPPPPLSNRQIEAIGAILVGAGSPDPAQLDTWRLTLTCDHVIDRTQHASNSHWNSSTTQCPNCHRTRGIVN